MRVTDNGREITAQEIRKMYTPTPVKATTPTLKVSALSLHNIVLDDRIAKRGGRQHNAATRDAKQIRRAVSPSRIGMRQNGISDAATALIKMAQTRRGVMTGDGLGDIVNKLSLPAQSLNGVSTDAPKVQDGARFASEVIDDEQTDLHTRPAVVGSQAISSVASSATIAAAVDAIKADMARGARPFLR